MRRRPRCHRCHVSEVGSSTGRCASIDCGWDAALGADSMCVMQRTEMRARSAPLDTLANSWAALETRAPSRAGTVSRAGSRASRQPSRAAASRGSRGMPQSGRCGILRDERTDEIQRLQNEIRSIKTACVHCQLPSYKFTPCANSLCTRARPMQCDRRFRRRIFRGCSCCTVGPTGFL